VGTLYVVRAPAGDPEDLTLRARRVLAEAVCLVADDLSAARRLLAHHGLKTHLLPLLNPADSAGVDSVLAVLATRDVALLLTDPSPVPVDAGAALIAVALERGLAVVPIPGPALPITALVISGLPTDAFVYLGPLPAAPSDRTALFASVASERRTLVALAPSLDLAGALGAVSIVLGDRPVAVMTTSQQGRQEVWRGTSTQAPEPSEMSELLAATDICVLVIGGASAQRLRWEQDRLEAEIRAHLRKGTGARAVSGQLAAESGWSRREIYRLVVAASQFPPDP
jgi:16S rRNA (cytidine1402-2'-O)-methyltransferase